MSLFSFANFRGLFHQHLINQIYSDLIYNDQPCKSSRYISLFGCNCVGEKILHLLHQILCAKGLVKLTSVLKVAEFFKSELALSLSIFAI